jgi:hypothetical protein
MVAACCPSLVPVPSGSTPWQFDVGVVDEPHENADRVGAGRRRRRLTMSGN